MREESNSKKWIYFLIGTICIVLVVVLVVLFLLQGDTRITSESDVTKVESITCENDDFWYPFFTYDNSNNKTIKINITLDGKSKLDTISLTYRLGYDNEDLAEQSEAVNHGAMTKAYEADSLSVNSFEARYADMGNVMQMTLYAKAKEINGITAKYFLLNGSNDLSRDTLTKNYNEQGLNCVILNKQDGGKGGK